jgi:hypothetical protein
MATRLNFSLNSYHNNKSQRERERERERVFDGYGFHVEISRNPIFLSFKKKKTIIASVLNMTQNFIFYFEKITWRF